MPISGCGFEQCYNAQAVVAEGSLLVAASDVVQAANDKQQLEPMLAKTGALPEELGRAETMLADNGYFSGANVKACIAAGVEPLIALGRDAYHQSLAGRFADAPPAPQNPTPVEAMVHRLQTSEGKKLYAKRKHIPEPVFGIIKSVLGFRQFLPRGLAKVTCDLGLEYEADVRPKGRLRAPIRRFAPFTDKRRRRFCLKKPQRSVRQAARGRFYNVVDLVNLLESEAPAGRQGRMTSFPASTS
jgi:hypothetical protein